MIAERNAKSMLDAETVAREEAAIRAVLASYNDALNGGRTAAVLPLYADGGVFMPPTASRRWAKARLEKPMTRCSRSSNSTSSSQLPNWS